MKRREFLGAGVLAAGVSPAVSISAFAEAAQGGTSAFPLEASAPELQEAMRAGHWSARRLTAFYLDRIGKIDRAGPRLNAVIELNPDAIAIA